MPKTAKLNLKEMEQCETEISSNNPQYLVKLDIIQPSYTGVMHTVTAMLYD